MISEDVVCPRISGGVCPNSNLGVVAILVAGEDEAELLGVFDVRRELDVLHLITAR